VHWTSFGEQAFSFAVPGLWNTLPAYTYIKNKKLNTYFKHIILIVFGFYLLLYCSSFWCLLSYRVYAKNVPPTSRRCTLNRTYRERNSAVWCGTVQCTFSCSLLRRISPYNLFYYDKWGNYTLSINTRGWYTAYTRVRLYTPNTPLEPIKNLGAWARFGGLCPLALA